jgi:hypothetical protein
MPDFPWLCRKLARGVTSPPVMFRALLGPVFLLVLSRAAVLVDFQVAQPPPLPKNAKQCTVKILEWVATASSETA